MSSCRDNSLWIQELSVAWSLSIKLWYRSLRSQLRITEFECFSLMWSSCKRRVRIWLTYYAWGGAWGIAYMCKTNVCVVVVSCRAGWSNNYALRAMRLLRVSVVCSYKYCNYVSCIVDCFPQFIHHTVCVCSFIWFGSCTMVEVW